MSQDRGIDASTGRIEKKDAVEGYAREPYASQSYVRPNTPFKHYALGKAGYQSHHSYAGDTYDE